MVGEEVRGDGPVVVIGAASMDIKARARTSLAPATSNHGTVSLSLGGVARNVAENLARLGVPTCLLTAVGDDAFGEEILRRTSAAGVDTSRALVAGGQRTATYCALLDETGDMAVSIDDMQVVEALTLQVVRSHRALLSRSPMIVLDANLSPRALKAVLALARRARVPVCMDPVSIDLAERAKPHLADFAIITPNASEAAVLSGGPAGTLMEAAQAAQRLLASGVGLAVITLAEHGLYYAAPGGSGHIPAPRVQVVDATGAGDALTAGVVYGLVNGLPVDECMRLGVSAATLTLRSAQTVSPEMTLERVYEGMALPDPVDR
jgi:pseudouridine kinase